MNRKSRVHRQAQSHALILPCLLVVLCFSAAGAWAQGSPAGKPSQSLWGIPGDTISPSPGVKSDTPQFESPTGLVAVTLQQYKEKCLPLPDNFAEASSGGAYREGTYAEAAGIIRSAPNPCEASIELKLFLESQKGEWVISDEKVSSFGVKAAIKRVLDKYVFGPVIGTTITVVSLGKLVEDELQQRKANKLIRDAHDIFLKTRGMKKEGVDQEEARLGTLIISHEKKLNSLTVKYGQKLEQYRPQQPYNRLNPSTAWQTFFDKESEFARQEAAERADILYEIASLEIQRGVLNQYRRPLLEKSCDEMMASLGRDCPQAKKTDSVQKPPEPPAISSSLIKADLNVLNGCLCRCTINPTIGVGATYDPKPWKNASPSCDDARYGPCVGFGLGCWREHMRSDGECFEQCVAAAGAKPQEVKTEIYQTRFKAYNDFLGEARSIIEEYLAYKTRFSQGKTYPGINRHSIQLAGNFPDDASLAPILFAAVSAENAPSAYAEMVREKNRRGDPDRALGLVRSAESVMPDRKASGETTNILAEFAIIMSKASLNIATEFEFDEGLYLLRKAAEFYKAGKSNPLGENIQRLIGNFEKWKEDWQILRSQIPVCQALIKDKRVCACDKLNSEKITPAANSLTIYEFASSEKWSISTATGTPRPLPEKDKIYNELKDSLSRAKNACADNPAMNTKEMKDLIDYETTKFLRRSPYINQEELKKNSAPVICDTRAVRNAEKLLSKPGLCDCQQEKIKGILDGAKKDEKPLVLEFSADKKEVAVGGRVILNLSIKGGQPPFSADMTGDYSYTQQSEARGFNINYQTEKPGGNNFYVTVVDSCGESDSRKVSLDVLPVKEKTVENKPKAESKMTVALRADKTQLKLNERTYVHINVQNHKPPYILRWGGHAQGLGDQGGKVPFVGASSPGEYTVTADVTDAGGRRATGSIVLTVIGETTSKPPVKTSVRIGQSKIIVIGTKPETSISPLKLKLPPGEQSQPLLFTYEHKNMNSDKMEYIIQAPSATTFMIEPSDSGASLTRISKPEKWGREKLFAVNINKDVMPGRKFTVTAYYSGVSNPRWIYSKYIDTGEDTEEYLKKNVKPATAIIEVIKGSASYQSDKGYNPLDDINITEPGNKIVDVAAVDKIGNEFQGDQTGVKQKESPKDKQSPPVAQSETYTGNTRKPDDSSSSQNTYSPPYIDDNRTPGKDWTDWTKNRGDRWDRGDRGDHGNGSRGDSSSSSKVNCDASQKQAAYQEGVKCGQKAKQNKGTMSTECKAASQGHMNRDTQKGWGSCLYSGFDEGYRAGLGTTAGGTGEVIAELENRAGENVHIFADGQDNFGPQNKLLPGEKKKVSIKVPKGGGYVKFIAGRNGQKLAECKWDYTPDSWSRVPVVKFSAPKSLACTTGLR